MHAIDPLLQYCPACGDEYRAGFTLCAACRCELLSGAEILRSRDAATAPQDLEHIVPGDVLLTVQKGSLLDMKQQRRLLAKAGVPALLVSEENCGGGCCGGRSILLQVRRQDVQRVAVLLHQEYLRTTAVDDGLAQPESALCSSDGTLCVCPACQHAVPAEEGECPDCGLRFV